MAWITAIALVLTAPADFNQQWNFDTDSLDAWIVQEGKWGVEEGCLQHDDRHFKGGLVTLPNLTLSAVHVEADVHITGLFHDKTSVWAGILVRASDPLGRGAWNDGYLAFIRADGRVTLHSPAIGEIGTATYPALPTDLPLRLAITAKGRQLTVRVNGETVITAENDVFNAGKIALVNYGNVATFDNVRVQGKPVSPQKPKAILARQPLPKSHPEIDPLARIGTRKSNTGFYEFFRTDTGQSFLPRGFNHTVLEFGAKGWHATFNSGIYDAETMEALLEKMAGLGANVIRVWIWGTQNESGFTAAQGLNGGYMENVVDFLTRCTRHGIYVLPVLDEAPKNAYYDTIAARIDFDKDLQQITSYNRQFLTEGLIQAKAQAAQDFITYIKQANPDLLPTVLGWSLGNEVFVNTTEGPFRADEGEFTLHNGIAYAMATVASRQQCYDDAILYWANTITKAIKEIDPEALVTAGMWTTDAHGRIPQNGLPHDGKDPRIPPRPSVLGGAKSRLDFLDVHIYPWDGTSKVNPECHERDQVVMPALIGEYGVFKRNSIDEARVMLREMLEQGYAIGYRGDLHWVWDLSMVEGQTWSSVEEGLADYVMGLMP